MLHVSTLFVAGSANLDEHGAINATRIPMTWFEVDQVPLWAKVPIVLVVHAPAGGDYDPELHVVCKDPSGAPRGTLRASWHWPDEVDKASKYRCFTQELSFPIESAGEYTIGAYYDQQGKFELSTPIPITILLTQPPPVEGEGMPVAGEDVPVAGEDVPVTGEDVPFAGEGVPFAGEGVPVEYEDVPPQGEGHGG
ncbi:hypothetical protein [Mycobacterium marinum]|uniref:hypothetical protein n=1 Tax=Mycobacterium marinum TaxID=1781 RepID=UPI00235A3441|nr:hypothetical protein [Mycobacterium marinum]MDC9004889.1 hypothetical protein [Mycobacterium marinum]